NAKSRRSDEGNLVLREEAVRGLRAIRLLGLVAQIVGSDGGETEELTKQSLHAVRGHIGALADGAIDQGLDALVGRKLAEHLVGGHGLGQGVSHVGGVIGNGLELTNYIRILGKVQLKGQVLLRDSI